MLIAVWDWLFTRRQWTIINEGTLYINKQDGSKQQAGRIYILKDQFGNIKEEKVWAV